MKDVFVVDDNVDTLFIVDTILSSDGYKVKCFANWKDLYNQLDIFIPSLILMDVYLGQADGRDIARQLNNSFITQNIPIILFSSDNFLASSESGKILSKPFKPEKLLNIVHQFIGDATDN